MSAIELVYDEGPNPIDRVERIAAVRDWPLDRTTEDEATLVVECADFDFHVTLNWREELETLHVASSFDMKIALPRRDEVGRLLSLINEQLMHGHFDQWRENGCIVYRHSLVLAGGAEANDAQCEAMIELAVTNCERFYPAVQFVVWAGRSAEDALAGCLFETAGEA
jgi:hypothetical protein